MSDSSSRAGDRLRALVEQCSAAGLRLAMGADRWDVVLDDPRRRNAQLPATWRALAAVGAEVRRAETDRGELGRGEVGRGEADRGEASGHAPRLVVLSATGPSFSAGLDRRMLTGDVPGERGLAQLAALDDAEVDATIAGYQEAFTWWRDVDAVTVAAVQGHAVGAGFQLALACDLMLVADDVQLVMAETSLGLVPDLAGTAPLVAAVGYSRALEICLTARAVDAREAVATGLAVRAVAVDALPSAVDELAAMVLGLPRGAAAAAKHLLRGASGRAPHEQEAAERAAQAERLRQVAQNGGQVRREQMERSETL